MFIPSTRVNVTVVPLVGRQSALLGANLYKQCPVLRLYRDTSSTYIVVKLGPVSLFTQAFSWQNFLAASSTFPNIDHLQQYIQSHMYIYKCIFIYLFSDFWIIAFISLQKSFLIAESVAARLTATFLNNGHGNSPCMSIVTAARFSQLTCLPLGPWMVVVTFLTGTQAPPECEY